MPSGAGPLSCADRSGPEGLSGGSCRRREVAVTSAAPGTGPTPEADMREPQRATQPDTYVVHTAECECE